jgi:NAD(P)-dependent dehydrogenase (short-subunit alcohol dehydrogenase family)
MPSVHSKDEHGRRRYESEFMNRELTKSFPETNDSNIRRRSLLGMTVAGLAGSLVACATNSQAPNSSATANFSLRRFEGKVVLITGATSGIGRAAALQFASEGGKVSFCGRRERLGQEVENEIRSRGGEASYIRADVRKESDVRAFVEYSSEEWDDVVNTNLRGVFLALKYEIPHMLASGGGNVLVTSSSNAIATTERRSAYTASKRGLVGLVQSAAQDYAANGIRVNALIPGTTDTELVRRAAGMEHVPDAIWEALAKQWAKSHVPGLERMAKADEIAAFALVLASDDHPYTGAQMVIDGEDRPCRLKLFPSHIRNRKEKTNESKNDHNQSGCVLIGHPRVFAVGTLQIAHSTNKRHWNTHGPRHRREKHQGQDRSNSISKRPRFSR